MTSTGDELIDSPLPIVAPHPIPPPAPGPIIDTHPIPPPAPVPSTSAPPIIYIYSRRPTTVEQVQTEDVSPVPVPVSSPDSDDDLHIPLARLIGKKGSTNHPIANYIRYDHLSQAHQAFISSLSSIVIPKTWQDAVQIPEWKTAMEEELPRLVARGYTQAQGIDYQETFAPVAKMNSIRVLFSVAASRRWELLQLDIKNAFLNDDLEEEVYMDIPPCSVIKGSKGKVCRVLKSLYGLKQSPRAWFGRFYKFMLQLGYTQSHAHHALFIKRKGAQVSILIVYVDDIIITGDPLEGITYLKEQLSKEFEVKDLGKKYTLDLLEETGMLGKSGCLKISTHQAEQEAECVQHDRTKHVEEISNQCDEKQEHKKTHENLFLYVESSEEKELNREKAKAAAKFKSIQEQAEQKLREELQQKEEEADVQLRKAQDLFKAELAAAIVKEKSSHMERIAEANLHINSLCMAFYARSEEARQAYSVHKLALGTLALEDALSKGLPIRTEVDVLYKSLEGIDRASLLALALSSLPDDTVNKGIDTPFQLIPEFDCLKGTLRHFSLIPSGGGGLLAHAVAHIASSIKMIEDGSGDTVESLISRIESFIAEKKYAEAADALEEGVRGTEAEAVAVEWSIQARNRAVVEQALSLLQSYALSITFE
ncbi:hypothetical protein KSP39_PZI016617 [Platanthera zijinensis]|uniref:Reverse transcriptase Ty1/copia-type domain-containing protein n=1 Tax=Platanthera zijinensis TaxID=2320716 RepID=A0AAP0G0A3_9ASPA